MTLDNSLFILQFKLIIHVQSLIEGTEKGRPSLNPVRIINIRFADYRDYIVS